jgi:hypothetical protein
VDSCGKVQQCNCFSQPGRKLYIIKKAASEGWDDFEKTEKVQGHFLTETEILGLLGKFFLIMCV